MSQSKQKKVLDLFCGCGGASKGISNAGYLVCGVDIKFQSNYPYEFYLDNALTCNLDGYDAYFASPPCQDYSVSTALHKSKGKEYPDIVSSVRDRLLKTGKPFVIENVSGAPIRKDLMLCMSMHLFDDGREFIVRRHRYFEIHGFTVPQPYHSTHTGKVGDGRVMTIYGHGEKNSHKLSDWKIAMGMPWARKKAELAEAIPPEYTQYIFNFLRWSENTRS